MDRLARLPTLSSSMCSNVRPQQTASSSRGVTTRLWKICEHPCVSAASPAGLPRCTYRSLNGIQLLHCSENFSGLDRNAA